MGRLSGPPHIAQLMQHMVQPFTGMGLAKTAMSCLSYAPQLPTTNARTIAVILLIIYRH